MRCCVACAGPDGIVGGELGRFGLLCNRGGSGGGRDRRLGLVGGFLLGRGGGRRGVGFVVGLVGRILLCPFFTPFES